MHQHPPDQTPLTFHCQKVLALLLQKEKPLSAYEILDALREHGFRSPPTVYRALDYLVKNGYIHRIESLNSFIACHQRADHGDVSQFAICKSCGKVDEIRDEGVINSIKKIKHKFLKQIDYKTIEITGVCRACTSKPGRAKD
ncbi:MAG: Fur family transcriptional regulator [Alphaproteobacteria bacterium]|nr:Fur family transcriptional regulator [Alphaproteobacteria bacterium]